MNPTQTGRLKDARTTVIGCLTARRRRELLDILQSYGSPANIRDLALELAAAEQEKSKDEVSEDTVESVRADLHHVHLPLLEDAALLDWDTDDETVTVLGHPALCDPQFQQLIETDAPKWDAVIANLANTQRRIIVSVLADRDGPLSRNELAREVVARDPDSEVRVDEEELLVSLHHVHLPKLADAGLVEYDAAAGTITYEGHPDLEAEWLEFAPDETSKTVLTVSQHSTDT